MTNLSTQQALPRLSAQQRNDLICKTYSASKGSALGMIASKLWEIKAELARLQEQLSKLEGPGGDRIMSRMVKNRLNDGKRIALDLLQKAASSEGHSREDAQLRLIIAEHADYMGNSASKIIQNLRRRALDELLQASA